MSLKYEPASLPQRIYVYLVDVVALLVRRLGDHGVVDDAALIVRDQRQRPLPAKESLAFCTVCVGTTSTTPLPPPRSELTL